MNRLRSICGITKNFHSLYKSQCDNSFPCVRHKLFTNELRTFHTDEIRYSKVIDNRKAFRKATARNYVVAGTIVVFSLAYAAVPLYGIFCQVTGYGGTTRHEQDENVLKSLKRNPSRKIIVKFNSDLGVNMAWKFRPQQSEIQVVPGETALAFYTATNPTDKPVIGVSTYNVVPFEAGPYFNKIQCFCFEEQLLNPHEQVDMPVFFYIDPEFCDDPKMEYVDEIVLSYTFYEAKEGMRIPLPGFFKQS